jgi:hypothetical protein
MLKDVYPLVYIEDELYAMIEGNFIAIPAEPATTVQIDAFDRPPGAHDDDLDV